MTRLNQDSRDQIMKNMLKHRFQKSFENLKKKMDEFADEVYDASFTADEITIMRNLPSGWLPKCGYIGVIFGSEYDQLHFSSHYQYNHVQYTEKPLPHKYANGYKVVFDVNHPLSKKYSALKIEEQELESLHNKTMREIRATLSTIHSVKKLLEMWPEAKPFVSDIGDTVCTALAIPIKDLNSVLGLPVSEQAMQSHL